MKRLLAIPILPVFLAVAGILALALWVPISSPGRIENRVPGLDGAPVRSGPGASLDIEVGEPILSAGKPSGLLGAWSCFRGPDRDGICKDSVPLARKWPEGGPEVLWAVDLGGGHAGAAVAGGCVYVLDYDLDAKADTMRCLSLDTGQEIWRNGYPVEVEDSHGMSRTVAAIEGDYVVSLGPRCQVVCWDANTGRAHWTLDLVGEYGTTVPEWHAGQCPLIDRGRLILGPSGEAFMVAVDLASGKEIWRTPKLHTWLMTHVSIAPMEFAGRRMYVLCGDRGAAGVSADDGSVLWETREWAGTMATCPTPVPVGEGRIFFTSGYHKRAEPGSLMVRLMPEGGRFSVESLFRLKAKHFESEQHTPIYYGGRLFGARTKNGGEQMVCLDLDAAIEKARQQVRKTPNPDEDVDPLLLEDLDGVELWNSGRHKYGRGPYLIADGLIYLLDDDGVLTVAEAATEEYRVLDRFQVFEDAHDAWGPMALADGRLIVRDLTRMACVNVAEQ